MSQEKATVEQSCDASVDDSVHGESVLDRIAVRVRQRLLLEAVTGSAVSSTHNSSLQSRVDVQNLS